MVWEKLQRLGCCSSFSYADILLTNGHRSHRPDIIHRPFDSSDVHDQASGNSYKQTGEEEAELIGEEQVESTVEE